MARSDHSVVDCLSGANMVDGRCSEHACARYHFCRRVVSLMYCKNPWLDHGVFDNEREDIPNELKLLCSWAGVKPPGKVETMQLLSFKWEN